MDIHNIDPLYFDASQVLANSFNTEILNPIGCPKVGTIHRSPNAPVFIFKI